MRAAMALKAQMEALLMGCSKMTSWAFAGWVIEWEFIHRPPTERPLQATTLRLVFVARPESDLDLPF